MSDKEIHYMLDMETLSTSPSTHILELALVGFDPFTGEVDNERTMSFVFGGLQQQGRAVSQSTVAWWLTTNPELFVNRYFAEGATYDNFDAAIQRIANHLRTRVGKVRVWCTGTFDVDILNDAIKQVSYEKYRISPFAVRDVRVCRQISQDFGIGQRDEVVEHTAFEDCLRQIQYVQNVYGALNERITESVGDQGGRVDVPPAAEQQAAK